MMHERLDSESPQWGDGVLLVGHGTRDPRGTDEFLEAAGQIGQRLAPLAVEPSFLELASPSIEAGWDRLMARGARRVIVAPLLLFAAGHAKQDIPAAVAAAARRHPDSTWRQADHLGCHPQLLELSARRALGAIPPQSAHPGAPWLVVAGRGSRDDEAIAETGKYAERLRRQLGYPDAAVGFLALAQPKLTEVLDAAARAGHPTILVVPHLLFHGELLGTVRRLVSERQELVPQTTWCVADHLGSDAAVVEAVCERIRDLRAAASRSTSS